VCQVFVAAGSVYKSTGEDAPQLRIEMWGIQLRD